jgi:hypothetical protein
MEVSSVLKNTRLTCSNRFSECFPEAVNDECNWIRNHSHAALPPNSDFSLQEEENYTDIISDHPLTIQHQSKSITEFRYGVGGE